ncbi:Ribonuclease inhibitor [Anabarilius grahami]|uniref:Ribonuclease inhibitor n=1 Tax=Anabarilius grahami TaxID=495550 RepID=A0A3N0YY66_ANAGA|nr:Ribonuclease inhibitor [Anabarilius grahami]
MDETQTSRDEDFSPGFSSVQQERSEPEPSRVSARTDRSMPHPIDFKNDDTQTDLRDAQISVSARYQAHVLGLVLIKTPPIPKTDTSRDVTDRIVRAQRHRRQQQKRCQPQSFSDCGVTEKDCAALTSVLRSNPSQLRELNLNNKKLQDSGVKLLSVVLEDPDCKLEKLWLCNCGVTDEGCAALASALRSNPSHLRELDLTGNKLGDAVHLLSAVLEDPHCKLEKLKLGGCGVTDEGCAALASALRSNPSHLRELNLTGNKLGDSVHLLSAVLKDPHCKLEILWLSCCGVTDEGCAALASALRSNPSHLRELDLSLNKVGDSVHLLSAVLEDPHCKLEILR